MATFTDTKHSTEVSSLLRDIKPAVIFHCASPKYSAPERILHQTNVVGTEVLLKCLSASPSAKALIYTSSQFAIVPQPGVKLTEDKARLHTKKTCNNSYSKTKAMAERAVLKANSTKLPTVVLRLPCVYGRNHDELLGSFMETMKKGQHKTQVGKNEKVFEYLYADKACEAHILAAKQLIRADKDTSKGKVDGEAFFLSDGQSVPFFDFARKVYAFAGHPVAQNEIQVMPCWLVLAFAVLGEWFYWTFTLGTKQPELTKLSIQTLDMGSNWDITKAKEILGYRPISDRDAVLKETVEYEYKRSNVEKDASTTSKQSPQNA
jgi:sterol-4alpha-carboxylate 3-dehydrogenase (decarboxylating)